MFENVEQKYAELDSKLVFYYKCVNEEGAQMYYYIMQDGGKLNMYENVISANENTVNIITYERNI